MTVQEIMACGLLTTHFQPLGRLRDGEVFGHEALVRGPKGHALGTPDALFAAAHEQGVNFDLEVHCVKLALQNWAQQGMRGRLLVNLSASSLAALMAHPVAHGILGLVKELGLVTSRLVVELTEHERVDNLPRLQRAVAIIREHGAQLALDDFGDGRSSLRLWAELKPDYVKIDKYFAKDIATHPDKVQTITALKRIAETFGTQMVAEGLETPQELRVLRDLGIELGQGYLLGRPQSALAESLLPAAREVICSREISVLPSKTRSGRSDFTVGEIMQRVPSLPPDATHKDAARRFQEDETLKAMAVVKDDGLPIGLINRQSFYNQYSKPYFKELYGSRSCLLFANPQPLQLESHIGLDELTDVLTSEDQRYLTEGFIITKDGAYLGMGTGERLVRAVTELRIEAARHANPLTFLPGNIPLTLHIARLLNSGSAFVACYADLNHFKPFNDYYGYWRGDEMIRLLSNTLQAHCDVRRDFIGHVGGDDFVILFQSEDWHERIYAAVSAFNDKALTLYDAASRQQGGIEAEDRDGVMRFFPPTTLSAGVMQVRPGTFTRAEMVASAAAAAKHKAKQLQTGVYVDQPGAASLQTG
ncbi:MAG TPA: phosphodiesterase [Aquabacterium sp.]|uniref:phosphodiesterase n=1 Tax=Aquabacterium sp. TaxID=1872578 RepID=UPI002E35F7A4|nr:phosphodiesterase [Aquabacterium sp.]HEX5374145.1 phosphodiesterase [Aquabacterium sp.]